MQQQDQREDLLNLPSPPNLPNSPIAINAEKAHEQHLCDLVRSSEGLMAALEAIRSLGLHSWCLGAGIIRALVWDHLHGYHRPSTVPDADVAFFDALAPHELDAYLERQLIALLPGVAWEVVNQAKVHTWYSKAFGQEVAPLVSLVDGLATWPETATCVGVYLDAEDGLHVIAPHGLSDLFEMRVRYNPRRVSFETFMHRVQSKRFLERWPRLTIGI